MAVDPRRIKALTDRLAYQHQERQDFEDKEKRRTERQRLIDSLPDETPTEFFCDCHGDFIANGGKIVFHSQGEVCAYYVSFGEAIGVLGNHKGLEGKSWRACRQKKRITDRLGDPYYTKSIVLQKLRRELADDLLQPNDPRYKAKYGDPYKKYNEQQEAKAKASWEADSRSAG